MEVKLPVRVSGNATVHHSDSSFRSVATSRLIGHISAIRLPPPREMVTRFRQHRDSLPERPSVSSRATPDGIPVGRVSRRIGERDWQPPPAIRKPFHQSSSIELQLDGAISVYVFGDGLLTVRHIFLLSRQRFQDAPAAHRLGRKWRLQCAPPRTRSRVGHQGRPTTSLDCICSSTSHADCGRL